MDEKNKEIKQPSGGSLSPEQKLVFEMEGEKREVREVSPEEEKMVKEQLKKEIELMELDEKLKEEAIKKAHTIQVLGDEEKLEHLLSIAKKRGIAFATNVAKQMNDPHILDTFHDLLAKEGYYKQFIK